MSLQFAAGLRILRTIDAGSRWPLVRFQAISPFRLTALSA